MRLWVFSDLHLTSPDDSLYQSFLLALDEPNSSTDHVVFAGDIFDLFVGNSPKFVAKNKLFFNKLTELAKKKVNLFYIEGNHDFHLDEVMHPCGVKVVKDEITLQDPDTKKRIYIAHGDLVDESDVNYLRLRKLFRNPISRAAILFAPGTLIERIAEILSRPIAQQNAELPERWSEEDRNLLRLKFRKFAVKKVQVEQLADVVILGHCHDLDEAEPMYWNMGYPPVHRQFLYYDTSINSVIRREFPRFI